MMSARDNRHRVEIRTWVPIFDRNSQWWNCAERPTYCHPYHPNAKKIITADPVLSQNNIDIQLMHFLNRSMSSLHVFTISM